MTAPESYRLSFWVSPDRRADAMAALDPFEPLAVAGFEDGASWRVEAWFFDEADARTAGASFADAEIDPVMPANWVEESIRDLEPVSAGRFFVYAPHWTKQPPAGLIPLLIRTGTAFGTGHHGTTAGCLEALSGLGKTTRPRTMLDLGCGTGILGIAAKKLWPAARLSMSDIDPVATAFAEEAARDNGVVGTRIVTAAGLDHHRLKETAPFDLIIANILARPLCALAPSIAQALTPGGHVILSGLLIDQEARVLSHYREHDLFPLRRIHRGDWSTLILH